MNHYLEGGYYPEGGSSQIAKKIIPTITKSGGAVFVAKKVSKILINSANKAYGVEMENGDTIFAKQIVSSVGIYNTFKKLITNPKISNHYNNIFSNIKQSVSHIYLFVKLKGTPQELQLRSSNIWNWPDKDYDKMLSDFYKNPLKAPMPFLWDFHVQKIKTWTDGILNIVMQLFLQWLNQLILNNGKMKNV